MDDKASNKIVAAILAQGKINTDSSSKDINSYIGAYKDILSVLDKESDEAAEKKKEADRVASAESAKAWADAARRLNDGC